MFILVVLALHRLFKPVNETHALAMMVLILISIPISLLGVVNEIVALVVVSGANFLSVFDTGQLNTLAYLSMRLHSRTILVADFWGLLAVSVRNSCHPITFYPTLVGLLTFSCSLGLSGKQCDLLAFASLWTCR